MKKITSKQARIIAKNINIDIENDGKTYYATTDNELMLYAFDTLKERNAFIAKFTKGVIA